MITIDKTVYTKAGDTWYKQTAESTDKNTTDDFKIDFEDPEDESTPEEDKTTYKSLGKEACGNLNCFKYEVIDPEQADQKNFIWFDDKDYQLRRSRTETPDGASEMTFEYDNVNIGEPSPVQELGPNQYIIPGQTEPSTIPTAADYGM
jgi:outer membrane lipoprotein-sorting protein